MDLPDLVLLELFSLVNVQERLGTLRLVCRRWKQLVEYLLKMQGSLIVYHAHRPFRRRWPSDDRPLSCLDTMSQSFFHLLLANDRYKWIKKLYLYQLGSASFEGAGLMVKLVDCMCQLEELAIDRSHRCYRKLAEETNIDLQGLTFPNLRVLSVKRAKFGEIYNIIAPRLERLVVWADPEEENPMINLSHPEQLKYLQCDLIDGQTRKFCNLEHLIAQHVQSDFELSHFSKLKRLDLCLDPHYELYSVDRDLLVSVQSLLEQRERLKLEQLEITNFGVRDFVPSDDIACKSDTMFEFIERSFEHLLSVYPNFKVEQLPWIGIVYYPVRLQDHRQLASLCSRINLQVLRVHDGGHNPDALHSPQPDPALLIRFLTELGGISRLIIGNCSFDQMFYDRLNEVPFIGYLHFDGTLLPADFGFICGIKSLTGIYFDHKSIPIYSFRVNVKKTNIIQFSIGSFLISLEEHQVLGEFLAWSGKPKVFQFDSLDAAFDSLEHLELLRTKQKVCPESLPW